MASVDPLQRVFEDARREFQNDLPAGTDFRDILAATSIGEVHTLIKDLQTAQRKSGRLRHLSRLEPFLLRLSDLAGVIEVFVQVKPDILALLWGPVKLILLWTSEWRQGYDAIIKTVEKMGELLPRFGEIATHFVNQERIKDLLALFYRDILDFYREIFSFFALPRHRQLFEVLWPRRRDRIKVVEGNIEKHAQLIGENITSEHIRRQEEARVKAFDESREAEQHRATQRFQALKTTVRPQLYDKKLDFLKRRICPGTSEWLGKHSTFVDWVDPGSQSTRSLWLQGIPGAGKTFLASWVVTRAKAAGRAIYAFLSHTHADTTTISIIHSLLFQLASEDGDIQAMLVDPGKREFVSDTTVAKAVLADALRCAGKTFLIVDGLDEVEESERGDFLSSITDLLYSHPGLKLCISSRAEDDIGKILHSRAAIIRIDSKNSPGIFKYVESRFKSWMREASFTSEGSDEIRALLLPICVKSKGSHLPLPPLTSLSRKLKHRPAPSLHARELGMFLYARIVIDNVVGLINIDDIRRDLRALPEDLNDAYARVLSRIEALPRRDRDKAKRILGWIGCSPFPLTQYELEQGLLVNAGSRHSDDAPAVHSSMNIVRHCGAIIEVVDSRLQFVHFTVKEYVMVGPVAVGVGRLTHRYISRLRYLFYRDPRFIEMRHATLDLLTSCLTYLCYDAVCGRDADEDQIRENLIAGKYRLLTFASSAWIDLVTQYVRHAHKSTLGALNEVLEDMLPELRNPNFQPGINNDADASQDTDQHRCRRPLWPGAPDLIAYSFQFYRDPDDIWTVDNAEMWAQRDPLIVSESYTRIERAYNRLLCGQDDPKHGDPQHCVCPQLHRHYGDELYRCHYFSCPFRRNGFSTAGQCAAHMENHCRPWKCPVASCDFAVIGFLNLNGLERHKERLHKVVRGDSALNEASLLEDEALYPLLYGLVDAGDVGELEAIWPACRPKVNQKTVAELVTMAAAHGSLPMVQLLWEWDHEKGEPRNEEVKFGAVVHDALQSGDPVLSRWLLEKAIRYCSYRGQPYRDIVVALLKSDSADAFAIWKETLAYHKGSSRPFGPLVTELFTKPVLTNAKRFPEQEHRLFGIWRWLGEGLSRRYLGKALVNVAQSTCSIEQARVLLELGASINYPSGTTSGYTSLHWACKKNSEDAAHFIRFLLLEGADPNIGNGNVLPREEVGAKKIQTWLGMDWSQLIRWATKERSIQAREERVELDE